MDLPPLAVMLFCVHEIPSQHPSLSPKAGRLLPICSDMDERIQTFDAQAFRVNIGGLQESEQGFNSLKGRRERCIRTLRCRGFEVVARRFATGLDLMYGKLNRLLKPSPPPEPGCHKAAQCFKDRDRQRLLATIEAKIVFFVYALGHSCLLTGFSVAFALACR